MVEATQVYRPPAVRIVVRVRARMRHVVGSGITVHSSRSSAPGADLVSWLIQSQILAGDT